MNSFSPLTQAIVQFLDFGAAFDTMDCRILLACLENWIGFKGIDISWFHLCLNHRNLKFSIGQYFSSYTLVSYGVPRGSILRPMPFRIYMFDLGSIIKKYNVSFHFFADD